MGLFTSTGRALWLALGIAVGSAPALAASNYFVGGADETDNSWEDPINWSLSAVPDSGDQAIVNSSNQGAAILDGNSEQVQSLQLNGGLNVNRGGSLTVSGTITNNGVSSAYFINDGNVTGNITNTYNEGADDDPDNDYFGYVSNTNQFHGNLNNSGAVINGGQDADPADTTWTGDVRNKATGYINNSSATWIGKVTENAGGIYNDFHAIWTGDVDVNSGTSYIENTHGSSWNGKVLSNTDGDLINNLEGATWTGDVEANAGGINNDGGTWTGDVLSNTGTIYNTAISTWNGDIFSSGSASLAGTVNGAVHNDGGYLYVNAPLAGVTTLTNTGALIMDDNDAEDSISAQSWSGTGTATFNFAPGRGRIDHVVLSGNYTADTEIGLNVIGPSGRALVDIPLIEVGGAGTGIVTLSGLPDDGVISYRLVRSGESWVVTSSLTKAPEHAAAATALVGRTIASATRLSAYRTDACGDGGWARALGGEQSGTSAGTQSGLAFGGMQVGYDLSCTPLPSAAAGTLGVGIMAGGVGGRFSQTFGADGRMTGTFGQAFGGFYGNLQAGKLLATMQGVLGITGLNVSDPQSALDAATLTTVRYELSGNALYDLEFGSVSLKPEVGFVASNATARSTNFADVGAMRLTTRPTLDAYAGASVAGRVALPDGTMKLKPFASLYLHSEVTSPNSAIFTADAGGAASVPLEGLGSYGVAAVGADLIRAPTVSGKEASAGLRADFKFGPQIRESTYSAYAQVKF